MQADIMKWIAALTLMIVLYLLLKDPGGTSKIISTIAGAQNNTILALQGRNPTATLG